MRPADDSRLNRELVSIFLALFVGAACIGMGAWFAGELVRTRQPAAVQTATPKVTCGISPQLAGLGEKECEQPVQLHPMVFR